MSVTLQAGKFQLDTELAALLLLINSLAGARRAADNYRYLKNGHFGSMIGVNRGSLVESTRGERREARGTGSTSMCVHTTNDEIRRRWLHMRPRASRTASSVHVKYLYAYVYCTGVRVARRMQRTRHSALGTRRTTMAGAEMCSHCRSLYHRVQSLALSTQRASRAERCGSHAHASRWMTARITHCIIL